MTTPLYPQVKVNLSDVDGNAFAILAACSKAARRAGLDENQIEAFRKTAKAGDYDNLLKTCIQWFTIN